MSVSHSQPQPVIDALEGKALLSSLCGPFAHGYCAPECSVVQPQNIPNPSDELLVHHGHMTIVLQRHHGSPMQVHVLEESLEGDRYTRRIALSPVGSDKIVERGIARIDLRVIPEAAKQEILAKQSPLGAILIKHNVHRRVKPRYFLRFSDGSAVLKLLGAEPGQTVYGRLGTIYCDNEPCIELLEIVFNP